MDIVCTSFDLTIVGYNGRNMLRSRPLHLGVMVGMSVGVCVGRGSYLPSSANFVFGTYESWK